jgi:HK97 family phage prohead protease
MNREFRIIHGTAIRAKADKPGIEGYAAKFNEEYDNGWFIETIKPGAFTRAVKEKQDVRGLMNHDANLVLGRTKSGTLSLNQDATGLYFECDLPDTQTARDLYELVKRGDIDGCSFGFQVMKQSWREEKDSRRKDDPVSGDRGCGLVRCWSGDIPCISANFRRCAFTVS